MEAVTYSNVLAMLAERVAEAVFATFEKRMSASESELKAKYKCIETLEKNVSRMEGQIDSQEQYSRCTSVRICGVDEARGWDDVGRVVESIIEQCNSASDPISMANVNRVLRVDQGNVANHGKPRQIIVQLN